MVEHKARRVEFKRRASDRGLYARYFSRGSVRTVQIEPLGEAYLERKYGYVDGLRVEHAELTKLFDTGWAHTKGKRQKPAKHPTSRRRHPAGKHTPNRCAHCNRFASASQTHCNVCKAMIESLRGEAARADGMALVSSPSSTLVPAGAGTGTSIVINVGTASVEPVRPVQLGAPSDEPRSPAPQPAISTNWTPDPPAKNTFPLGQVCIALVAWVIAAGTAWYLLGKPN